MARDKQRKLLYTALAVAATGLSVYLSPSNAQRFQRDPDPADPLAPLKLNPGTLPAIPTDIPRPLALEGGSPLDIAFHPSRFADPAGGAAKPQPATTMPVTPFARAVALEKSRDFTLSRCFDLQGNLWVGTEGGGIQKYDPSKPPLEAWTQYTTKDGLGDDNGYAITCDKQGRIWAGHLNHGVSVYAGKRWQNYEVVGGLSRPDTLSGPLGERIFHITVAPDGDVWICTSAGLTRYSVSKDVWSYFTRADGLPSDQSNALAFDNDGTAYLATQCDGIAIASGKDNYASWKQIKGPDELPITPTGAGLPTNLINDVFVAKDGTIYAATTAGLAWSADKGESWKYVRGADYAEKVKGRLGGTPKDWVPQAGAILAEDYSTALVEDAQGNIHAGHRATAGDVLQPQAKALATSTALDFVSCLLASPVGVLRGSYGQGLGINATTKGTLSSAPADPASRIRMPNGQKSAAALAALKGLAANKPQAPKIPMAFLGEDWSTKGDWVGRYGRQYSNLCASNAPRDDIIPLGMVGMRFSLNGQIGPHIADGDGKRGWLAGLKVDDANSPWNPFVGTRREGEWDDHGEAYALTWEGPDLIVNTHLPEGLYRFSLYFYDGNGYAHALAHVGRDFQVLGGLASENDGKFTPLTDIRVEHFHGGVYKQFLLEGDHDFRFVIKRNGSLNTILNAIFIDRLSGPPSKFDGGLLGCMGSVRYDPPAMNLPIETSSLWQKLTAYDSLATVATHQRANNILACRVAAGDQYRQPPPAAWRWAIPLWTPNDRQVWNTTMQQGWESFLKANPSMRPKEPATTSK